MKRLLLWTVIGLITMTTTSCESKQEILDQMEQELSKMRQNVDTYSYEDWKSAAARLDDLYDDLQDCGELTNEEQQRFDKINVEVTNYVNAAHSVQMLRDLWEELKDIALTADSEEVIDYLKRWNDVMEDIKKCELTPKQKAEVKELVTKIVVLGNLPIRSPDSF